MYGSPTADSQAPPWPLTLIRNLHLNRLPRSSRSRSGNLQTGEAGERDRRRQKVFICHPCLFPTVPTWTFRFGKPHLPVPTCACSAQNTVGGRPRSPTSRQSHVPWTNTARHRQFPWKPDLADKAPLWMEGLQGTERMAPSRNFISTVLHLVKVRVSPSQPGCLPSFN